AIVSPLLPSFEMTVGGRIVGGLLLGAIPGVAMAYIAENISSRSVGIVAGTYVAGNTLGGILGRLIAGPLAELLSWRAALLVVGIIAALVTVVFLLVAPKKANAPARDGLPLLRKIGINLRDPYMLGLYSQGFFVMGAFVIIYNFIGFQLQQAPINLDPVLTSFVFVIYLFGTLASRQAGKVVRRFGPLRTILGGIAVMLLSLPLMTTPWLLTSLLGLALFTIGCFTSHPTASSLSGQSALAGRNQASAMYQMCFLGGTSLFGWLGGVTYSAAGWSTTLLLVAGMCVASASLGITGLWLLRNRRPHLPVA
ncbi:MAG: transporter, partial [Glaciihabitans sp.]|nr:transporter [Glaciihabitans sp.]